ncbi:hypothetical protein CHS0354_000547 [Potamilus streckersoni]|uniref:Aldehyde dehydrogenase domain-containing protein n=1 Tax=Potamilus streckersoni TaxID=2493646 RepID=A0AAE0T6X1_9BIVA|nr:hypothetical protein CHS0354_000547 [Potamilus streckersoni]
MATTTLAAIKMSAVLLGISPIQAVVLAGVITLIYSTLGGLKAVILTDVVQFIVAMIGSVGVSIFVLTMPEIGGLTGLVTSPVLSEKLSFFPDFDDTTSLFSLFIIPLAVQWWSVWYPGSEPGGGGYVAQRILSAKNEKEAIKAVFFFNIAHYALRPWPWVIVALASIIIYPTLDSLKIALPHVDPSIVNDDSAYSAMVRFVPNGLLGLVVASLMAAYMSTISTHLNWGASYLVHDFFKRFVNPQANESQMLLIGKSAVVLLMITQAILALFLESALQAFNILLSVGAGPGYMVSVGYMDPGNWATDIAGGSQFGYQLIWVLLMSNIMAVVLQSLSARLGVVYGRDLAQASRESYPPVVNFSLYVLAELAIAACDLAEVLGLAIGLQLLFDIPILWGVALTLLDTFLLLILINKGIRKMEAFILILVLTIGFAFLMEMIFAQPDLGKIVEGFIPSIPNNEALYIAIGIIGATVMPHNLYLHSSLVQSRKIEQNESKIREALKFNFFDSVISLNLAFLVNAAILILAASTFYNANLFEVTDIKDAYHFLEPLLGTKWAPILFAIALIAAGQSSTLTEKDIPSEYRLDEPVHQREYLCNGEMRKWYGAVHEVYSPVCIPTEKGLKRKLIGSYPICTTVEAMESLEAAFAAYSNGCGEWPTMDVAGRIACVEKFMQMMLEKRSLVVKLIMWEIGKSYADSIKEFDRTAEYIYATIDALKDIDRDSSRFKIEQGIVAQIRRSPLGVVLCMGPFNYPLNETFTTLIPALIMGNTILFKPPKYGTLLHYPLFEAFRECFPKGVVNIVYGRGNTIVPDLMKSGKINVLALIGSSKVANELKKLHPKVNRLRAILGLDAKNASIVTQHADLKLAVKESILGSLSFNGQRCTALKILFIQRNIVDKFLELFVEEISKLKIGMPWESGVSITPLPELHKPEFLVDMIKDAKKHGAKVVNSHGGEVAESLFFPAVVYPVTSSMRLYHEEQFGPIVPVVAYDSLSEPIKFLIESTHGQQVSFFSNDAHEIASVLDHIVNQVSRVNINTQCQRGPDTFPFTGRKDSAEGTLSVVDALRSFSIRSVVATKLTEDNKKLLNTIVEEHESHFLSTKFIF